MRSVSLVLPLLIAACEPSHPFTGTRCNDARTLETCTCSHEFTNCECQLSTCEPGACVSVEEGALCSPALSPSPECAAVVTGPVCVNRELYACSFGYRELAPRACDGVCVVAGRQALCSASVDPWPGCDPAQPTQQLCGPDGITIDCVYGYRRGVTPDRRGFRCPAG